MKINIDLSMIQETLELLNKIIAEYEQVDRNILSTLKASSFFWNDNVANDFFNELDEHHKNNDEVMNNLKDNTELFSYVINNYSEIGNKIKCNLDSKDTIINKINNILEDLNNIILSYGYLNTYFCPYERNILFSEKKELITAYNTLNTILNNITNKFKKMELIEKNIKSKISKLNSYIVNDFDTSKFT